MDFRPIIASTWNTVACSILRMMLWTKCITDKRQAHLLVHWALVIYDVIPFGQPTLGKALVQSKRWQPSVIDSALQAIDSSMLEQKPRFFIINTSSGHTPLDIAFYSTTKLFLTSDNNHTADLTINHNKNINPKVQKLEATKQASRSIKTLINVEMQKWKK